MTKTSSFNFERFRQIITSPGVGPLIALILASLFFAIADRIQSPDLPRFLTGPNWSLIAQQTGWVAILAIGQTLVILTAGIDLSCGTVMALGSVIMTKIAVDNHVPALLAILIGFLVTGGFGFINGMLITRMKLPPFIVTLGTLNIANALTLIYTVETIQNLPREQTILGETFKLGNTAITYGTVVVFLAFLVVWFVLRETPFGRHIYAVGDNPESARLTGISTNRLLVVVYTLAGLFYGFGALILIARTGVGDPQAGQTANLDSITAVVLGGTSLFGGRGNVLGTLIGALIVGVFRNGLQIMGVPSIFQVLITGILVILAVSIDQLSHRREN